MGRVFVVGRNAVAPSAHLLGVAALLLIMRVRMKINGTDHGSVLRIDDGWTCDQFIDAARPRRGSSHRRIERRSTTPSLRAPEARARTPQRITSLSRKHGWQREIAQIVKLLPRPAGVCVLLAACHEVGTPFILENPADRGDPSGRTIFINANHAPASAMASPY
eukprot:1960536-Prymnesium_polylepis.1